MSDKTNNQVEEIRKLEVVDVYEDLLSKIWARTSAILGVVTVQAIMKRCIVITQPQYPWLGSLEVEADGLQFSHLKRVLEPERKAHLKEGFEEIVLQIFDLLAKLTGEVIVEKLFRDLISPTVGGDRRLAWQRIKS